MAPLPATPLLRPSCSATSAARQVSSRRSATLHGFNLVDWHDRTLRRLFREHGGEEVDHAGDGFFVAFTMAGSALGCAIAIQQPLVEHRRHHGYAPPVRIGVHSASAMRVDGGYRGKGIHAAARIGAVAAARGGRRGGLRFSNLRRLELKGLLDPIELVTIDWA